MTSHMIKQDVYMFRVCMHNVVKPPAGIYMHNYSNAAVVVICASIDVRSEPAKRAHSL